MSISHLLIVYLVNLSAWSLVQLRSSGHGARCVGGGGDTDWVRPLYVQRHVSVGCLAGNEPDSAPLWRHLKPARGVLVSLSTDRRTAGQRSLLRLDADLLHQLGGRAHVLLEEGIKLLNRHRHRLVAGLGDALLHGRH